MRGLAAEAIGSGCMVMKNSGNSGREALCIKGIGLRQTALPRHGHSANGTSWAVFPYGPHRPVEGRRIVQIAVRQKPGGPDKIESGSG
jgi:hypothetical protein